MKKTLCGPPKVITEAVLLNFEIEAKQLLEMRRSGKSIENQRVTLASSVEFDQGKLLKILNEMDKDKSAYVLNSQVPQTAGKDGEKQTNKV